MTRKKENQNLKNEYTQQMMSTQILEICEKIDILIDDHRARNKNESVRLLEKAKKALLKANQQVVQDYLDDVWQSELNDVPDDTDYLSDAENHNKVE